MPLCGAGSSFEAKEPKLRGFRLPRTPKRHLKRRGLGCYLKKLPKSLAPRRNELRYTQYNQRLNCCTLRYCSLIEKILRFFRRGEAAKSFGAVVLTIAYRFELASTMRKAEPYCVPADLSFFQNTTLI